MGNADIRVIPVRNAHTLALPKVVALVEVSVANHPTLTTRGILETATEAIVSGTGALFLAQLDRTLVGYALVIGANAVCTAPQIAMLYNGTHEHAVRDALLRNVYRWAQEQGATNVLTTLFRDNAGRAAARLLARVFPDAKVVGVVLSGKVVPDA